MLEVEDYGHGMTVEQLASFRAGKAGVGTQGMRERVRHAGGTMTVESSTHGTKVGFTFPL